VTRTLSQLKVSLPEKDEHKISKEYKKLSPKMKGAVDAIFKEMDAKPSDFLNTFDKTITTVSKEFKVPQNKLLDYFEREVLTVM
jgi:predicted KAP-like P-loop ATPase|tara:strand:+ start:175 stop:426 length:252 start_codon:yes stop_codon:yes gene_type:complete